MTGLLLALATVPGWAADDGRQKAAALVDEGNKLFEQKRFAAALGRFEQAYAAFASPKILLNLAEAHRELGALDRSAAYYDQFLDETKESDMAKYREFRDSAEQRLGALAKRLGKVELTGDHDGASVTLGSEPITTIRDGHFWIVPGSHRLVIEGGPTRRMEKTLSIKGGDELRVAIEWATDVPSESPAKEPSAEGQVVAQPSGPGVDETPAIDAQPQPSRLMLDERPDAETDDPITSKWWFWTAVGVVVVGGTLVAVAAASGGGDAFVPTGELGRVSTSEWQPFSAGGLR